MAPTASVLPLLLATGVAMGLSIPISKAAVADGVHPFAFATWPTLVAGIAFGLLAWRRQPRPPQRRRLLRFGAVAGLFGHAAPMSALFWLTAQTGAGFAALAFTLPPVFTLAITLALGIQAPSARRVLAVAVGLSGALLLAWGRSGDGATTALALALVLAIPASIGAANVYRSLHLPPGTVGPWLAAATLLSSSFMLLLAGLFVPGL
jgi:drug/metabolite transporter (DMT)-like permease